MISYIKGKIILSKLGLAIVETNGVGYKVAIDSKLVYKNGESVEFFIHEHIREDADDLYGFKTYEELELFEKLISVSGVGPKVGLLIMAAAPCEKIIQAIICNDASFFTAISGIGKKVAAKIILELKSKLGGENNFAFDSLDQSNELLDTLEGLGWKKAELSTIITQIPSELTGTEEKLRWCLKKLSR